jgi:transcriptional regulator with XRE-family HTH domain
VVTRLVTLIQVTETTITLGRWLRDQRVAAGLSLRQVAERVGTSHVFWGEIERGRKALPPERWERVSEVIPGVTVQCIADLARTDAKNLQMSLREAGPKYEQLGELLLRRAKKQDLSDDKFIALLRMLSGGDE